MAHGDAREEKWRGKMRMEWVASSLELGDGARSIQLLSADPHSLTASSWLNWHPRRFKWTRPFRWKTKSGFCACAITFRTSSTLQSDVHRAVHRNIMSTVKPTRCTNVSNLFYFGMTLYMFRTVFPSTISSSRLYILQQAFVKQILLTTSGQQYLLVAICTVLNSWWWTERPSETCRASFQRKINLIHWCILLVLL